LKRARAQLQLLWSDLLWWCMKRCEHGAQWFRFRWLQRHEGRGAIVGEPTSVCCVERFAEHAHDAVGSRWGCSCGRRWRMARPGEAQPQ
jgi:hypothetical protein